MWVTAKFVNINTNGTKQSIGATSARLHSKDPWAFVWFLSDFSLIHSRAFKFLLNVKEKLVLLALLKRVISASSHLSHLLSYNS